MKHARYGLDEPVKVVGALIAVKVVLGSISTREFWAMTSTYVVPPLAFVPPAEKEMLCGETTVWDGKLWVTP
jgi:hypothetical protein